MLVIEETHAEEISGRVGVRVPPTATPLVAQAGPVLADRPFLGDGTLGGRVVNGTRRVDKRCTVAEQHVLGVRVRVHVERSTLKVLARRCPQHVWPVTRRVVRRHGGVVDVTERRLGNDRVNREVQQEHVDVQTLGVRHKSLVDDQLTQVDPAVVAPMDDRDDPQQRLHLVMHCPERRRYGGVVGAAVDCLLVGHRGVHHDAGQAVVVQAVADECVLQLRAQWRCGCGAGRSHPHKRRDHRHRGDQPNLQLTKQQSS